MLLLRANQFVDVAQLADELWDGDPPRTAVSTVRTHVYHLRQFLEHTERGAGGLLHTRPGGYLLRLGPDQSDAAVFTRAARQGRALVDAGRDVEGVDVLRRGLDLWDGPTALSDVTPGPVLSRYVLPLDELRMTALMHRVEAGMRLGLHRELLVELRGLAATYPLNEWFHARLIEALHHCGRRDEALAAFRRVRDVLRSELGLEPAPELHRLQNSVLDGHSVPWPRAS